MLGLPRPLLAADAADGFDPDRPLIATGRKLRVQPVFMHTTFQKREATSWQSWNAINTPEAAAEERQRIGNELAASAVANQSCASGSSNRAFAPWKSPVCRPRLNHFERWSEVPWVKESGTT